MKFNYQRKTIHTILQRLEETPQFIVFITGPRRVGKTILVEQALNVFNPNKEQFSFVTTDAANSTILTNDNTISLQETIAKKSPSWLINTWEIARNKVRNSGKKHVLAIDEIQKLDGWSEIVKGLWDSDRLEGLNLHIILLGSSPLLMRKGMTESLAGRYEIISLTHWSWTEMSECFNFSLDDYIYFGGYPGCAKLIQNEQRWYDYITQNIVPATIEQDILYMTRVDKPALLKQLFELGARYSGQLLAYDKIKGGLDGAGNTTTLTHYTQLLTASGLLVGIDKYANQEIRRRASVPKWNVLNTAFMSVNSGYSKTEAKNDRSYWGRIFESTIGAHLYNSCTHNCKIYYWRNHAYEVDFVITRGSKISVIEVKSGQDKAHTTGFDEFEKNFGKCRKIVVGAQGIPIIEFLSYPLEHWL